MDVEKTTDLVEIGQKTIKHNRSARPDQTPLTDPGDNKKFLEHSLYLAKLPKVDLQNPVEVEERCFQYFESCAAEDLKPSVSGLALALGVDRRRLWEAREGLNGKIKNQQVSDTLKKMMQILDVQMVDYMQNGKINPVSGIFLMKNNFGYQDKQEVVVTPNNPLGEQAADVEELRRKYAESLVPDA